MDTKWKNWTASKLVKVLSFILIPVIIAGAAVNIYAKLANSTIRESGIDEEIIFAGARNPETFFNQMIMPVLACNGLAVILTGG
ncbi:MAG: DUF648 domain-containing protein, partial [Oscillospiraceae bacterium]|nr:DUF648 domain-containing protein [Oscillospiraceae bacterium]